MQDEEFEEVKIPKIAVIGLEGSGKTVLVTTLAKRLSIVKENLIHLNPVGAGTLRYVENCWAKLQSGEWPASTPPGELFELRWKMTTPDGRQSELRLLDAPGQDLRKLFTEDAQQNLVELPEHMQVLAQYSREADIILLLLNIRDFIESGANGRHIDNQVALKTAMDYINAHDDKELAVIFTQMDRYDDVVNGYGGLNNFLMKEIPYIYGAHVHGKPTMTMTVAAVNDTIQKLDEKGVERRVPAPGFGSRGLNSLAVWLGAVASARRGEGAEEGNAFFECVDVEVASARQAAYTKNLPDSRSMPPPRQAAKVTREPDGIDQYFKEYFVKNLRSYANFEGRARRKEFWYYTLFSFFTSIALGALSLMFDSPVLFILVLLALFIPSMAITVRRLHDVGKNFVWAVLPYGFLLAIGIAEQISKNMIYSSGLRNFIQGMAILWVLSSMLLFGFLVIDGTKAANAYGPSPKYNANPRIKKRTA